MEQILQPDWLLTPEGWKQGWHVVVRQGTIASLGPAQGSGQRLSGQALLPGLVNAHSHAFQRLIRGRTEFRDPQRPEDDFWSWRELMYQSALGPSPDQLERVARLLYLEMVESGITTVGEFHYQHHQPDGRSYAEPDAMAWALVRAARWAGIQLVLLRCAYHRSGFALPPNPRQVRFLDADWEAAVAAADRLQAAGVAVGLAPHSVRAVPPSWLRPLAEVARLRGWPLHMHVSEQPAEIEQCRAECGLSPVQLLEQEGVLGSNFTAVHAIHLEPQDFRLLSGAHICSCPTTERNLGDGVVAALELRKAGCRFALGTDSQCQVDLWEDARQLDYHLRLIQRKRAVLDDPPGQLETFLWQAVSLGGASSLGQPCGQIAAGLRADLLAVDLEHPVLACDDPHWLLAELIWSMPRQAIAQVWSAGVPRLQDGRHPLRGQAVAEFRKTRTELGG